MRISPRRVIVAAALAVACGGGKEMLRRFTPADADARAREYLALLSEHRLGDAEARVVPELAVPETHVEFARMDTLLGGQRLDSIRIVGAQVNVINGVRHVNMTYEAHPRMGWLVANVATVDSAGTWFVEGVSVRPIPQALETATAFTLAGRSATHFAWLALAVVFGLFSLATAIWIATRRGMPRRGLWALAALVGVGSFSMNWTTGETGVHLLSIQLFSAGAVRLGPYSPWVIVFGLPVGAAAAIAAHRRWRREPAPVSAAVAEPAA